MVGRGPAIGTGSRPRHEFADGHVRVHPLGLKNRSGGMRSDGEGRAHVPRDRTSGQRDMRLEAAQGMIREVHFAALRA